MTTAAARQIVRDVAAGRLHRDDIAWEIDRRLAAEARAKARRTGRAADKRRSQACARLFREMWPTGRPSKRGRS